MIRMNSDKKKKMIRMNSDKKNGISISTTSNCKANLKLHVHSIHQNPKSRNGAMFACQMLMVLGTKQAKPTHQFQNRCRKCGKPVCCNHILQIGPECQKLLQGAQFYKIVIF